MTRQRTRLGNSQPISGRKGALDLPTGALVLNILTVILPPIAQICAARVPRKERRMSSTTSSAISAQTLEGNRLLALLSLETRRRMLPAFKLLNLK